MSGEDAVDQLVRFVARSLIAAVPRLSDASALKEGPAMRKPDRSRRPVRRYSMTGASFETDSTSSPSHCGFLAVPSNVALVLNSSYLPSKA